MVRADILRKQYYSRDVDSTFIVQQSYPTCWPWCRLTSYVSNIFPTASTLSLSSSNRILLVGHCAGRHPTSAMCFPRRRLFLYRPEIVSNVSSTVFLTSYVRNPFLATSTLSSSTPQSYPTCCPRHLWHPTSAIRFPRHRLYLYRPEIISICKNIGNTRQSTSFFSCLSIIFLFVCLNSRVAVLTFTYHWTWLCSCGKKLMPLSLLKHVISSRRRNPTYNNW